MPDPAPNPTTGWFRVRTRSVPIAVLFLLIEFYDELAFGFLGAALPALRHDLVLNYLQVGILLGLPGLLSVVPEAAILSGGDNRHRRWWMIGGGLAVAAAYALTSAAHTFPLLLIATILLYPAIGAFVTLAQASLMDAHPEREAQAMARWTLAGSLGGLAGPAMLAAVLAAGFSWRAGFAALSAVALVLAAAVIPARFPSHPDAPRNPADTSSRLDSLRRAVGNRRLVGWILLIQVSDLGLDIFGSYMPLYLVDVVGVSFEQAALAVALLHASDLVAGASLIPALEKLPPLPVLRWSAGLSLAAFAAWMAIPGLPAKLALLVVIGFVRASWYPILQGQAYAAHPGRSAGVGALGSLFGPVDAGLVWAVGAIAHRAGIGPAMLIVLAAPVAILLAIRRRPEQVQ